MYFFIHFYVFCQFDDQNLFINPADNMETKVSPQVITGSLIFIFYPTMVHIFHFILFSFVK